MSHCRLLLTGERDWDDRLAVELYLERALGSAQRLGLELVVVHGDCKTGADHFAREWCEVNGIQHDPFPADWHPGGQKMIDYSAGPRRNAAAVASGVRRWVAFWSGRIKRSGTNGCMALAVAAGIDGDVIARKACQS